MSRSLRLLAFVPHVGLTAHRYAPRPKLRFGLPKKVVLDFLFFSIAFFTQVVISLISYCWLNCCQELKFFFSGMIFLLKILTPHTNTPFVWFLWKTKISLKWYFFSLALLGFCSKQFFRVWFFFYCFAQNPPAVAGGLTLRKSMLAQFPYPQHSSKPKLPHCKI